MKTSRASSIARRTVGSGRKNYMTANIAMYIHVFDQPWWTSVRASQRYLCDCSQDIRIVLNVDTAVKTGISGLS